MASQVTGNLSVCSTACFHVTKASCMKYRRTLTRYWTHINRPKVISSTQASYGWPHYSDVIMGRIASQITSLTIVYPIVCSGVDQRKHQSSASLAFVRRIHRRPVNSPHKWPVTRKKFPFDDVIMHRRYTLPVVSSLSNRILFVYCEISRVPRT